MVNELNASRPIPHLILNATEETDVLPGSFRWSGHLFHTKFSINRHGLDDLHLSGSAQFSHLGLSAIKKQIGNRHITILNLRNTPVIHIFPKQGKGGIAASLLPKSSLEVKGIKIESPDQEMIDQKMKDTETSEIEANESMLAYQLSSLEKISMHSDCDRIKATIHPHPEQQILTSKQLVTKEGLSYFQIPKRKFGQIDIQLVDDFVSFVRALPPNEHLHIHSKHGRHYTTLFMAMYDMMRNASKVSYQDILFRQGPDGLGGSDFTQMQDNFFDSFLQQFYLYCRERSNESFASWTQKNSVNLQSSIYHSPSNLELFPEIGKASSVTATPLILTTLNDPNTPIRNLRSMPDIWTEGVRHFNTVGLKELPLSGSNQYSETAFGLFMKKMMKEDSSREVTVCDLRHEKHCFVNGMDVYPYLQANQALSAPMSPSDILKATSEMKQSILKAESVKLLTIDTNYPSDSFDKKMTLRVVPQRVETPQEMVTRYGAKYLLIGNNRFCDVSSDEVDQFVTHVTSMQSNGWMHIHCKKGKTRTTAYMVFFDMLHNADKVSWEDIIRRQHAVGGSNLFDVTPKDPSWPTEKESKTKWIRCLAKFHSYAKEEYIPSRARGKAPQSWTEWSKSHQECNPIIEHLLVDTTAVSNKPKIS